MKLDTGKVSGIIALTMLSFSGGAAIQRHFDRSREPSPVSEKSERPMFDSATKYGKIGIPETMGLGGLAWASLACTLGLASKLQSKPDNKS